MALLFYIFVFRLHSSSFVFYLWIDLTFISLPFPLSLSPLLHPEWVHYYKMSCVSLYTQMLITYTLLLHIQSSQPKTRQSSVSDEIDFKAKIIIVFSST